uniref:potassium channel subfamily K member 1-like n=1 Tax=Pristiophorus japonicus TaxID=55135 RepID=UPI00398EC86C
MLHSLGTSSSCLRLLDKHRSGCYFASLLLAYLLYLSFGALVFSAVELPYEDSLRRDLREFRGRFLRDHPCLAPDTLQRFVARVLEANNYGVSVLNNGTGRWNWDFTSSLFFAATVLTTTVYLMLGLTAVLVVLETFCELQKLKEFKRIFYLKKDKPADEMNILDQDQLSFPSVMDSVPVTRDQQKLSEPFVTGPTNW